MTLKKKSRIYLVLVVCLLILTSCDVPSSPLFRFEGEGEANVNLQIDSDIRAAIDESLGNRIDRVIIAAENGSDDLSGIVRGSLADLEVILDSFNPTIGFDQPTLDEIDRIITVIENDPSINLNVVGDLGPNATDSIENILKSWEATPENWANHFGILLAQGGELIEDNFEQLQLIRNDIEESTKNIIHTSENAVRCNVDFLETKASNTLERIAGIALLAQVKSLIFPDDQEIKDRVAIPFICHSSINYAEGIKLNRVENSLQFNPYGGSRIIHFSGFNFQGPDLPDVYIESESGILQSQFTLYGSPINTNYDFTVNLDKFDFTGVEPRSRLVVDWGFENDLGLGKYSVQIVLPDIPTATPTPTFTLTPTPIPSLTPTLTPTSTSTPTLIPTNTPTSTPVPLPANADGDSEPDISDAFPNDPTETKDSDNDGVGDNGDAFPNDSTETKDSDNDGVGDNGDAFPNDSTETKDSDNDGVGDNGDAFPNDSTETKDSDNDGVGDNGDAFPNDPTETKDSDNDGVGDNDDAFPNDPTETKDSDNDGVGDNGDAFPNNVNIWSGNNGIIEFAIDGENDSVYVWYQDETVTYGSTSDLDSKSTPYDYRIPVGKDPKDIVGIGIDGPDNIVYTWYRDGTVTSGATWDLASERTAYNYLLPPGKSPDDILGIGIEGESNLVFAWYKDGTVSAGTTSDLDAKRKPEPFSLALGKNIIDVLGIGIDGPEGLIYVWYSDGTVSSGSSTDLDLYRPPYPYNTGR